MKNRIPLDRINWKTSSFLIGTAILAVTAVPAYLWHHGLNWFESALFTFYFFATGMSITLGYHRLFAHLSFKAKTPVKLFTLIFGAAAFQNSVIDWVSDHRKHHKYVDHEEDPYDITKGFFHAHMGWLLFKINPVPPLDNVNDLFKDPLVVWQHKWCHLIGSFTGFILPALLGWLYGGPQSALGCFLIAGVARVVFVQHMTFFINSFCHTIGKRPYSSKCTARDSFLMAIFTYGEGYHNFHHEFQHDYRNGVKFWQLDPTKWAIWALSRLGLVFGLRRVPKEKILLAELAEARRQIASGLETWSLQFPESARQFVQNSVDYLQSASHQLAGFRKELQDLAEEKIEMSREMVKEMRREIKFAMAHLDYLRQVEFSLQST